MDGNKKMQLLGQSSNSQNNMAATNDDNTNSVMNKDKMILLPDLNTKGQIDTSSTNEANPSVAEPSNIQPKTLSSSSDSSDSDDYETDSSLEEVPSPEKAAKLEEIKKRLAIYEEMLAKKKAEEKTKNRAKRNAEDPPDDETLRQKELRRSHNVIQRCFQRAMDEANVRGFVYGIVLEDGSVLQGSSQNLSQWWEENVRIDPNGAAAAERFYLENPTYGAMSSRPTCGILMEISDSSLGLILSVIMQCCKPSQRKYPLEKKMPPPWWPSGKEPWWGQTSALSEEGPPPYQQPCDLKKIWKAAVIIAIIKYMTPKFARLLVQSNSLEDRISDEEINAWYSVLHQEGKMYYRDNPDMPPSDDSDNENEGNYQPQQSQPQQQQQSLLQLALSPPPLQQQQQQYQMTETANNPTEQRMLPEVAVNWFPRPNQSLVFICEDLRCPHSRANCGFGTAELRDQHKQICVHRNSAAQFRAPFEFPPMVRPQISPHQAMVPPPYPPMVPVHTSPNEALLPPHISPTVMTPSSPLQMAVSPPFASVNPPPRTPHEQVLPSLQQQTNNMPYHQMNDPNSSPDKPLSQ